MKTPRPILFGTFVFCAVGVLIVTLAIGDLIATRRFLADAEHATGTVEDISTRYQEIGSGPNRSRSLSNLAAIRFQTESGEIVRFEHTYGLWEGVLETGAEVRIAYQPETPIEAKVESFAALWAGIVAMLVAGGVFIGAGFLVHRVFGRP